MEKAFILTESEQEIQAFIRMIPGVTSDNFYVVKMLVTLGECSFFSKYFPEPTGDPIFTCMTTEKVSAHVSRVTFDREKARSFPRYRKELAAQLSIMETQLADSMARKDQFQGIVDELKGLLGRTPESWEKS